MATKTAVAAQNGKPPTAPEGLAIDRIQVEALSVPILGQSPLIMHRFSEKAKRQMLDAMQGRKSPKQPKDPESEYEAAFYRFEDESYGFPVAATSAPTGSTPTATSRRSPGTRSHDAPRRFPEHLRPAWQVRARRVAARLGSARFCSQGSARPVASRSGWARLGLAGQSRLVS